MRNAFKTILALSFVLFMLSCTSSENKFVGKWKLQNSKSDNILHIEKKEVGYDMYPKRDPSHYLNFTYDKERDQLTSNGMGGTMDIKFIGDKDHIELSARMRGIYDEPQRFERAE